MADHHLVFARLQVAPLRQALVPVADLALLGRRHPHELDAPGAVPDRGQPRAPDAPGGGLDGLQGAGPLEQLGAPSRTSVSSRVSRYSGAWSWACPTRPSVVPRTMRVTMPLTSPIVSAIDATPSARALAVISVRRRLRHRFLQAICKIIFT